MKINAINSSAYNMQNLSFKSRKHELDNLPDDVVVEIRPLIDGLEMNRRGEQKQFFDIFCIYLICFDLLGIAITDAPLFLNTLIGMGATLGSFYNNEKFETAKSRFATHRLEADSFIPRDEWQK